MTGADALLQEALTRGYLSYTVASVLVLAIAAGSWWWRRRRHSGHSRPGSQQALINNTEAGGDINITQHRSND